MKNISYAVVIILSLLVVFLEAKINLKHIISVDNIKSYKKVLKTHTNVLAIYSKQDKSALNLIRWVEDIAKEIKGKGTIVYINCGESKDSKKLCKKYNISPKPTLMKHFKDGSFHKDYDRKQTSKSMLNFMLDPTGDAPWEEDPAAENVVQLDSEKELIRLQRKEKGPMLMMFYAPWCGYCKKLKPDYAAAATELKGKVVLAGMNVDKPDAANVRYQYNISGYPTIVYFEKGEKKFNYGGGMDKKGIIEWLADPKEDVKPPAEEEKPWATQASEILHLTDSTFDDELKENPSMLIMFYAPWCGHCKAMKPEYVSAAKEMKEAEMNGTLAAMDCTTEKATCQKFDVSGYPTVRYFENGENKFKLSLRKKDNIIEFMKNPEAPPPPPREELPWPDVSGPEILHLDEDNFKEVLKKKKHVLVMFYAPWCGHCKKAKPEMEEAASHYKDDRKVWFAGVDCTVQEKLCEQFNVDGYPIFRYFLYGKKDFSYSGSRSAEGFIEFMKDPKEKVAAASMDAEPQWSDEPSGVVHLGDDDFEEFIKTHSSVLVMFYAPWCGHCKQMKPGYTEAANEMLNENHVIAAIDCTKNRQTASKYDISGYPTLKHYKNGEPKEYFGGRTKNEIMSYLLRDSDSAKKPETPKEPGWADENQDVVHLDDTSFDDFVKTNPSVLVMFYAPWCGHCKRLKPAYGEAAKMINTEKQVEGKLAALDCTQNDAVCGKFEIQGYPTVKYFKNGVMEFKYEGGRKTEDIVAFMKDPRPKPVEKSWSEENTDVIHLTSETFPDFLKEHESVMVMFYAPWCGHCKKLKPTYSEAAKIVNTDDEIPGKLAALDCTVYGDIAEKYEIRGYPTLKFFKNGKDFQKYEEARTTEAMVDFMKNSDKHVRILAEWKDEKSDIHHLTNETFDEFIKDRDVLVMFYAPWCGYCKEMKPAFMKAAKGLKQENFPGLLAAIDCAKYRNISKREEVKGYPTLRYYSNGKYIKTYEDYRTTEKMMAFMKQQFEPDERKQSVLDNSDWEDLPSSVVYLTPDTFETHLMKAQHVLITFHIKWCKNCLETRHTMMKAASRLEGSFGIAALNCDKYKELCAEQSVTSYPAIRYYNNGKFAETYPGPLNSDSVVSYMVSKSKEEL